MDHESFFGLFHVDDITGDSLTHAIKLQIGLFLFAVVVSGMMELLT